MSRPGLVRGMGRKLLVQGAQPDNLFSNLHLSILKMFLMMALKYTRQKSNFTHLFLINIWYNYFFDFYSHKNIEGLTDTWVSSLPTEGHVWQHLGGGCGVFSLPYIPSLWGSRSGDHGENYLFSCDDVQPGSSQTFWGNVSPLSSAQNIKRSNLHEAVKKFLGCDTV
jgi:hypothetical protein